MLCTKKSQKYFPKIQLNGSKLVQYRPQKNPLDNSGFFILYKF